MAHYDCDNCGARMGVAFGSCESCTPKEYFAIKREMLVEMDRIEEEFENLPLQSVIDSYTKHNIPFSMKMEDAIKIITEKEVERFRNSLKKIEEECRR